MTAPDPKEVALTDRIYAQRDLLPTRQRDPHAAFTRDDAACIAHAILTSEWIADAGIGNVTPDEQREQDVQSLADSIGGHFERNSNLPEWMQPHALGRDMRPLREIAARAVLSSDWLAEHIEKAKAAVLCDNYIGGYTCITVGTSTPCDRCRVRTTSSPATTSKEREK